MRNLLVLVATWLFVGSAWCQQSVNTSAGKVEGGAQLNYSIGQVFINVADDGGDGGTLSEGVQQGYHITVVSGQESFPEVKLRVKTYPNPVTDVLQLYFEGELPEACSYVLVDVQGKLLMQAKISEKTTELNMRSLHSGTYLLRILQGDTPFIVFKVVKN